MSTLRLVVRVDVTLFLMSLLAIQMPRLSTAFLAPAVRRGASGLLQHPHPHPHPHPRLGVTRCFSSSTGTPESESTESSSLSTAGSVSSTKKGKLLVLGGTGFLGQTICKRAVLEGYSVTSLSRRGLPPLTDKDANTVSSISTVDYRQGDARVKESIAGILQEGGYTGVVHCIGLLFDNDSGLGSLNVFVSGSGSLLDSDSSYDTITRLTGFHAIDAAMEYAAEQGGNQNPMPFVFTSAAEAGWPDAAGGPFIEKLMPEFIQRYLKAKRAVESKLMSSAPTLRPIIVRPSLIYSMDRPTSYVPVGAFTVLNKVGLPFVDRPVTVQSVGAAIVAAMGQDSVSGVLRYKEIDALNK
jgi:nucleoside-diphosphate-sugar epimerase